MALPADASRRALALRGANPVFVFVVANVVFALGDKIHGSNLTVFCHERGLSYDEVGLLFATIGFTMCLTDLPTGTLADRYGRLRMGALGFALYGIGLLLFMARPLQVFGYLAAVLLGLAMSCCSGSFSGWFKARAGSDRLVLRRGATAASVAHWVAASVSGLAAFVLLGASDQAPFLAGGLLFLAGAAALSLLFADNRGDPSVGSASLMAATAGLLLRRGRLRLLLVATLFARVPLCSFILGWQPLWLAQGASMSSLGLVFAALMIAAAAGSTLSNRLVGRLSPASWVALGALGEVIGLLILALSLGMTPTLLGLVMFEIGFGLMEAGIGALKMELVPAKSASSVLSGMSTAEGLAGFATFFSIGAVLDAHGPGVVFALAIGFAAVAAGLLCRGAPAS